jgi:hypothetical protein
MSFTQLKNEAARLPSKAQRKLIAFLISLQTAQDQKFKEKLAARIDDQDPGNWMDLEQVRKKYAD